MRMEGIDIDDVGVTEDIRTFRDEFRQVAARSARDLKDLAGAAAEPSVRSVRSTLSLGSPGIHQYFHIDYDRPIEVSYQAHTQLIAASVPAFRLSVTQSPC